MKQSVRFLLALVLVMGTGALAQTAPTEAQPQSQSPSALTKPSTSTCPPPCLSPEQEAALVEVRKILQEARQVAEGIKLPEKGLLTRESELKMLRDRKAGLIDKVDGARFEAGDFNNTATTRQTWLLAVMQAKYGHIKESVQTSARDSGYLPDSLLVLVDALIKGGDTPAALTVAEAKLNKQSLEHWRYRDQAAVFSLIARRQHEKGDPAAKATLQRALQAALAVKYPPDRYLALLFVARAQAMMGDRTASAETFRLAIQSALTVENTSGSTKGDVAEALRVIAKAQAESGDRTSSDQTFQQAIQVLNDAPPPRIFNLGCIAWSQIAGGNREAGVKSFDLAVERTEVLSGRDKARILSEISKWQIKAGEREAVAESLERARKAGADVTTLAAEAGYLKLAMDLADSISDFRNQAGALAFISRTLVETKDPYGTPEVFQQLSHKAAALLQKPLPNDEVMDEGILSSIALIQAAAGDIPGALHTVDGLAAQERKNRAYGRIVMLLIAKEDLAGAKQVAANLKEDRIPWGMFAKRLYALAKALAQRGEVAGALALARQQPDPFDRGRALVGAAVGIMERQGIEHVRYQVPDMPIRDSCPVSKDPDLEN